MRLSTVLEEAIEIARLAGEIDTVQVQLAEVKQAIDMLCDSMGKLCKDQLSETKFRKEVALRYKRAGSVNKDTTQTRAVTEVK
jgi:hypothetical protein